MQQRILIAGSGGQGVLVAGKLLVQAGMARGYHVTYLPAYGAEVRGGTANCHVVIADRDIYSPMVDEPDSLIIMNRPSYSRFKPKLQPGGLMVVNSSMIDGESSVDGRREVCVPASQTAAELGNVRVANVVMLGAFLRLVPILGADEVGAALEALLTGSKAKLIPINMKALARGAELAQA